MRLPVSKQGDLAWDKLRAECTLSPSPIPGVKTTVQEKTTTPVEWVGRFVFSPVSITTVLFHARVTEACPVTTESILAMS